MPLVIAVLVILVLIFNAKDSNKNNARQSAIREKDRRKTNARLEQRTLDMYMKHGYSFDWKFAVCCKTKYVEKQPSKRDKDTNRA